MVRNEDLGIPLPGLHPVLVFGGSKFTGGPVRIAPGSGSKKPQDPEIALPVDPSDCDPVTALTKHTRFRVNDVIRIPREALQRRIAKLKPPKHKDLLVLREHGL